MYIHSNKLIDDGLSVFTKAIKKFIAASNNADMEIEVLETQIENKTFILEEQKKSKQRADKFINKLNEFLGE